MSTAYSYIISPADGEAVDTATPNITWQAVNGVNNYYIQVQENHTNDTVWFARFPADTTSTVFNSNGSAVKPLQSGITYRISIGTYDSNGNQASTRSTFMVQ